jgi:uncharacterized beta-barrel protein YwiB (DUF1934 family)
VNSVKTNAIPVKIVLHTKITDSGENEDTKLTSDGTIYWKSDAVYLRYDEMMNETDKVNTTIKIKDEDITIIRSGAVSMKQRFAPGSLKEGTYESPYGPIQIATKTETMDFQWHEGTQEGKLSLNYRVLFQGEEAGFHELVIKLRGEE